MAQMSVLEPPPYLWRLRDQLRESEPGRWTWFASDRFAAEYTEAVRLELLQSTYRMEEAAHPALYSVAGRVLAALELDIPVTFYQAQDVGGMNASLCFLPGEAHLILRGPVLSTLNDNELTALVGHELAHFRLWTLDGGSLRVANEVIESIASHPGAHPSFVATALRARRYTEVYADRGSYLACGDPRSVIACLVKVQTGLSQVDPDSYVRQANEIFSKKTVSSDGISHPEAFIRARAISLWHEQQARCEAAVAAMVQGPLTMEDVDVLDQVSLAAHTRTLIARILKPAWFRTDPVVAHARAFFPDADATPQEQGNLDVVGHHQSVAEYLAYVLLDFAVVDESLGEVGLAHGWTLARDLGITDVFEKVARDELKMTKRAFEDFRNQAGRLLERAAAQAAVERA